MDVGHKLTDELLAKLEAVISSLYSAAAVNAAGKLGKLKGYFGALEGKLKALASGALDKLSFGTWKGAQAASAGAAGLADELAADLTRADILAASLMREGAREAFGMNYNFGAYQIENGARGAASLGIYDREAVRRLLADSPELLPPPKVDIPRDLAWNKRHLRGALAAGIMKGESVDKIAVRLRECTDMDRRAAIRNARTALTGAENAGRVVSYSKAAGMGINVRQQWVATVDGRTRHTHRQQDGDTVEVPTLRGDGEGGGLDWDGAERFANGCRFPGDPTGPRGEVYGCRCTLVPKIGGFDRKAAWREGEGYSGWKAGYAKGEKGYSEWLRAKAREGGAEAKAEGVFSYGKSVLREAAADALGKSYTDIAEYWEDYLAGKTKNPRLDGLLGTPGFPRRPKGAGGKAAGGREDGGGSPS